MGRTWDLEGSHLARRWGLARGEIYHAEFFFRLCQNSYYTACMAAGLSRNTLFMYY